MEKRHCPYLGIIDDPSTHAGFPDESNACHRAKKPVRVSLEYQETHCLCDAYQECPGYINGWENGFPLELRADYDPTSKNIFKRIQFWREEQQKKKSQKEEQKRKKGEQDLKEALQSKLQFKKKQPDKEKGKIVLEEEPVSKKAEVEKVPKLEPTFQPQEQLPEKTILQDEAALKEYLQTKRKLENPLLRLFSKKTETTPKEEQLLIEEQPVEQEQPLEEKPNQLPTEWVKEEELIVDHRMDNLRDELARKKKQQNKGSIKKGSASILPSKKEKPERKSAKKKPRLADTEETAPQDILALRDKKKDKAAWKEVFKDRRVWWASLVIILIFLLVIFIPQLPSVNLNIRERLDGLFNPPISATTSTTVETPVSSPEGITQTEEITSAATEALTNTPSDTPTEQATPTTPATATITPTSVPTLTPTPGPPPFIFITRTP